MGDQIGIRDSYIVFSRDTLVITAYNMPTWSGSRLDNQKALGTIALLASNGYEYGWDESNGNEVTVFFFPPGKKQELSGPLMFKSESF